MSEPTFTAEEKAQHARDYEAMLVERYRAGLSMSKADEREAQRLLLCNEGIARKTARILRNRAKQES